MVISKNLVVINTKDWGLNPNFIVADSTFFYVRVLRGITKLPKKSPSYNPYLWLNRERKLDSLLRKTPELFPASLQEGYLV